jgi:hypothetical protein
MPIDKSRLDRMITMIDDWMKQREEAKLAGTDDYDIENPLEAPPNAPFADAALHQPKRDLFE